MKKILFAALMLFSLQLSAKVDTTPVYLYGFAASFNDSTVYLTEVQKLDTAFIVHKKGFLLGRHELSEQLKDYLESQGFKFPTCAVSFSKKKTDAKKRYEKLLKRYKKHSGDIIIKIIPESEFKFKTVCTADDPEPIKQPMPKKKKSKKPGKPGKGGPGGPGGPGGGPGGDAPGGGMPPSGAPH